MDAYDYRKLIGKGIFNLTPEELERCAEFIEAQEERKRERSQATYDRKVRQPKADAAKAERLRQANRLAESLKRIGREDLT